MTVNVRQASEKDLAMDSIERYKFYHKKLPIPNELKQLYKELNYTQEKLQEIKNKIYNFSIRGQQMPAGYMTPLSMSRLGISMGEIWDMIKTHKLPAYILPDGTIILNNKDVMIWQDQQYATIKHLLFTDIDIKGMENLLYKFLCYMYNPNIQLEVFSKVVLDKEKIEFFEHVKNLVDQNYLSCYVVLSVAKGHTYTEIGRIVHKSPGRVSEKLQFVWRRITKNKKATQIAEHIFKRYYIHETLNFITLTQINDPQWEYL